MKTQNMPMTLTMLCAYCSTNYSSCSVNICQVKINKSANQKRNTQIFTFLNPRLKCECPFHLDYDHPSKFLTETLKSP